MVFNLNFKGDLILHLLIIIILIGLISYIKLDTEKYNCDECMVDIKWETTQSEWINDSYSYRMTFPINELYKSFIDDECLLIWDKVNGYIYLGNNSILEIENG